VHHLQQVLPTQATQTLSRGAYILMRASAVTDQRAQQGIYILDIGENREIYNL
jgi:hypothetical protein